ncbi:MAG TPA: DUF3999 family protein [Acidobacteriaceae bacterium]|jgi:hypothetical protein|nr:DUF3999 family protein [Acidobacteriaceae bacterium]
MHGRAVVVLLALAAATPNVKYFRYERGLDVQTPVKTGQTCAVLDGGIYAHAAAGLVDVRLYRGTGSDAQETPFVIREAAPVERQQREIAPLNLGRKGPHTSFTAEMPAGRYSDVELNITAKDFIATVAVTGAPNETGREGTELGLFTIFDLTAQKLGRSMVLHLPESDLKYLYFSIDGQVKPEDVHGVSVERVSAKQQYVTVADTNQLSQKDKSTIFTLKVPARVPVERIEFAVGDQPAYFSREVTVKAQAVPGGKPDLDQEPAQAVESSGNLLRLHTVREGHKIDEEDLAVGAPWTGSGVGFGDAGSTWTLTVDNGDDAPLAITDVKLEMADRRLCFDAAAGAQYTLMYGDAALAAPRYDYATLFAPDAHAAVAVLGAEEANPELEARADERPFTEKHPGLLWVALVAVVGVLAVVAVRTAKSTPKAG